MDEREDELARLLEHARADAPSAHVLGEVRDRLLTSIGEGAAASAASSTGAASSTVPALKLALPLKLIAGAVTVGAVVAAALVMRPFEAREAPPARAPRVEPVQVVPAPRAVPPMLEPAAVEPVPEVAMPGLEPPIETKAPKRARPKIAAKEPAAPVVAAPSSSAFAEELGLIKGALEAQRAGRIDEARTKLGEHARRFPNGQLTHERQRIEAKLSP